VIGISSLLTFTAQLFNQLLVMFLSHTVHSLVNGHALYDPTLHYNRFTALLDFVRDYPGKLVPERQNQEGKTNLDLLEHETVSGSGICWAICKSDLTPDR